jgi:hypothetical protein
MVLTMTTPTSKTMSRVRLPLFTVALLLALAAPASADAPTLKVTNVGQYWAPVDVAQPPIEIAPGPSCAYPFTISNESACPPGTWPALGTSWGQIEDVAGGDTLRLEFSSAVAGVKVSSTSNYPPGLRDPDGKPVPNYDVVPESSASATSDPAVWLVPLPQLDARAISSSGYTFSVVSQDESGFHDYAFGIRSPRWANELTKCGTAYYSTGWQQFSCGNGPPKAPPPGPFGILHAKYTGRVVTLKVNVPGQGNLRLGVPTTCGERDRAGCHRRAWISRHARRSGIQVIRKALTLRMAAGHRIAVAMRFQSAGEVRARTATVKVHLTSRAD